MIPHRGEHYPLPILPATPSSPSRTLEGFFELTRCPSRALDSPRLLLLDLQRIKVRCAALGAEVPENHPEQLMQTMILSFFENALLFVVPKIGGPAPLATPLEQLR